MIKSGIPVPAKLGCNSSIPKPIKNKVGEDKKPPLKQLMKIKPPLKQSSATQPCTARQVKAETLSVKLELNPTKVKTAATRVAPKKPILSTNQHVQQIKVQPLVRKPVKKPLSVSANTNNRKTIIQNAAVLKTKTQKTIGTTATNQSVKVLGTTKQLASDIKLKNESKKPGKVLMSKHGPKVKPDLPNKVNETIMDLVEKKPINMEVRIEHGKGKEDIVDLGAKQPQKMDSNFGVSDSEFVASDYFKTLILSEKELSPGIIKICSQTKSPSDKVNFQTPAERLLSQYKSADDFVEDVRRNSARFLKRGGRSNYSPVNQTPVKLILSKFNSVDDFMDDVRRNSAKFFNGIGRSHRTPVNQSPEKLILSKYNSIDDFVDDVRRNSARFLKRNGKSHNSPVTQYGRNKSSPSKSKPFDILSIKENLVNMNAQRVVENKKIILSKTNSQMNFDPAQRRWTCNVSGNLNISNMSTCQIADEIRRLSLIRKDSLHQLQYKTSVLKNKNHYETLNPHQKVLKEIEILRSKKENKVKKKVTFLLPGNNSPELQLESEIIQKKSQSNLSDIAENDSKNSTPELDLNFGRKKFQSEECKISAEDSTDTTPEFNLPKIKSNHSLRSTETFNLVCGFQNVPAVIVSSSDEVDKELISCERTPSNYKNNCNNYKSPGDYKNISIDDIQSLEKLSISSFNEKYQSPIKKESNGFCIMDRKIYTPHPVAKNRKSDIPSVESPVFLPGKSIAVDSLAPFNTPFVLRNKCTDKSDVSSVRQKLNFGEHFKLSDERRQSQIIIQNIPTAQKMFDSLCDKECCIISSLSTITEVFVERLTNPIVRTLSEGDEMHFIPISSP